MKNFIKKHCWSCEYFDSYNNKCELTNLSKSKNSICRKWKLVKCLRQMKQIIKEHLYPKLGITVLAIIIAGSIFSIMYIANGSFVILYIAILHPLIMLGIYKIVIILYTKNK